MPSPGSLCKPSGAQWLEEAREREREGRVLEAIASYEAAIAAAEERSDAKVLAESLRRLAVARHHRDECGEAIRLCRRSYDVAHQSGYRRLAAEALNTLGGLELSAGRLEDARRTFLTALDQGGSSARLRARVEQNLGILANIQGDLDAAAKHYTRSLEGYRRRSDLHGCAIAYNNLGLVSRDRNLLDAADRYFRESLAVARRTRDVPLQVLTLVNRAGVDVLRQRFTSAKDRAEAALALCDRLGWQRGKSEAYRVLGMMYRETSRPTLAESALRTAIELAAATGSVLDEAEAMREMAILHQSRGRNREALELLNSAYRLFGRLDARVDLIDVGGKVAALEATYRAVVHAWGESIESSDRYTFGHCERVAQHAVALARELGLGEHEETTILFGAYLHDVGKVRIPAEILHKPGPLTPAEWEVMRMHPVWGAAFLSEVDLPWDIEPIVRWHHERYDGSGYPDGLRGEEIPLGAQIVGIANIFDALTTPAEYRPGLSVEEAVKVMSGRRHWWSYRVFVAFLDTIETEAAEAVKERH